MSNPFDILTTFPGVAGYSCQKKGAPAIVTSKKVDEDILKKLTLQLSMLFTLGEDSSFQPRVVKYKFDIYTIIGLKLEDNSLLLVLCEPQANSSLIVSVVEKMRFPTQDS